MLLSRDPFLRMVCHQRIFNLLLIILFSFPLPFILWISFSSSHHRLVNIFFSFFFLLFFSFSFNSNFNIVYVMVIVIVIFLCVILFNFFFYGEIWGSVRPARPWDLSYRILPKLVLPFVHLLCVPRPLLVTGLIRWKTFLRRDGFGFWLTMELPNNGARWSHR